jgi:Prolyl oligopeptidase family
MKTDRREFGLGLTAALIGIGAQPHMHAQNSGGASAKSPTAAHPPYLFKDPTFEMIFLTALGRAYHSAGNVGKVLYLTTQVEDGNYESAYLAFKQAGDEARAEAEDSASRGHKESARQAYMWAQNYYDSSTYFVDGSKDPTRFLPTWELLYDCWIKSLPLFDPPIEPVNIPYENTELHGFFIRGKSASQKRPLLILVNGSDGSLLDMWLWGGAGAISRGYDCLTFDGPGQGYALWKQNLYFRPDWEKVIAPVVDYALSRPEVDPKRIALQGISQGGYWVPRALAFERRIAAGIADPGVVDVSTSWTAALPKPMLELLKAGRKAEFDGYLEKSLNGPAKMYLNFRMRPFGFKSSYDTYKAVLEYNLEDVAKNIRCPMLITEPVNESYWPGQSRQLYDLLTSPKKLVHFSESDGADLHCEPKGNGLRDLRAFNWLDEVLK